MIFPSNNDVEKEKIMQRNLIRVSLLAGAAILLGACSATQHRAEVQDDSIDRVLSPCRELLRAVR